MKKIKIRIFSLLLIIALAISMSIGLSACNNDDTSTDVLIVGSTIVINSLNRMQIEGGEPGYNYDLIAASLTQLTPIYLSVGKYHSQLCNYSTSDDGLTLTLTVKDGYTWHDGTTVTAADLEYTLKKDLPAENNYESIATEGNDVIITLASPNPRFLNKLTTLRIFPKHIFETATANTLSDTQSVIGCGPFMFESRNIANNTITFVKYDRYPDADKIAFNKVIMRFYGTEDVMHLALKSGELDMEYYYSSGISVDAEADFATRNDITVQSYSTKRMEKNLFFNSKKVTDARVRKAIQKAINYSTIRASFSSENAAPTREGFIPESVFGYFESAKLTRDLDGANSLLTQAGYSTTNKFPLNLLIRSDNNDSQYAPLIKTALEETGMITVSIDAKAVADYQATYQAGNHDAALGTITPAGMDFNAGLGTRYLLARSTEAMATNPVCYGNYDLQDGDGNPTEFGRLYFALANATSDSEYCTAAKNYQTFMIEQTPAISLNLNSISQAYSKNLSGFVVDEAYGLFNVESFLTLKKAS